MCCVDSPERVFLDLPVVNWAQGALMSKWMLAKEGVRKRAPRAHFSSYRVISSSAKKTPLLEVVSLAISAVIFGV